MFSGFGSGKQQWHDNEVGNSKKVLLSIKKCWKRKNTPNSKQKEINYKLNKFICSSYTKVASATWDIYTSS